jgi:replicative DNA helicase
MASVKVPPNSNDAEQSVLGAILLDKDSLIVVSEFLRPQHFYNDNHAKIYEAILTLYAQNQPVDVVTLAEQLKKKKVLTVLGGASYLAELVEKLPTAANIEHYAHIVRDHFTKRELIKTASEVSEMAYAADGEIAQLLDKTESSVFALSQSYVRRGFIHIKDVLTSSFDRLDTIHKTGEGLRGVPTGFIDLDLKLSGLQENNLVILAARPGQGKTAFVLNMSQYITAHEHIPVGFFSLEMSKEELVDRLMVAQADIDAWRLKTGRLTEDDFSKLSEAMGELAEAPLFIDDTPGLSIMEMRSKARRLQSEHGIKLLIVDYLQLINPGRRLDNRVVEVAMISQGLKNIARELKIPVLAVSQLSRAVEHRGEKKPQLADLRESGAIEQDADIVMFIYRPEDEIINNQAMAKLLIAKHRNGPAGEIDLLFRGDRVRFYDVERNREQTNGNAAA